MSQTVDKRVVEMSFENQQFEKGVDTSTKSVDKLKASLNFEGVGKSFGAITDAANRVNLGSIAHGVETISSRFSALGIVAVTTLVNMTNAAIQAGMRIARALTIDPITTGLNEYETKLNSVQTILANTQKEGTNLEIVTKALNELNEYSDKTIYNFQQMTRNVGTFTAAGVDLQTSVASIKGISNLAAISGSNAEQASTAMYQLSQALSSGTVKLMDWNSVVNAGMGGQVFQDAIKETARVHGVAIDDMIKQDGSFRETLQRGWFTSEILTETLSKFTGDLNAEQLKTMGYTEEQIAAILKMGQTANDAATKVKTFTQLFDTLKEAAQSGWAQTWEIVIGDFEEAKAFLTELNNWFGAILGASADARNEVLKGWKDLGGRTALIKAFENVLNSIIGVINPIKDAFRSIFPPTSAQQLMNLTNGLVAFTEKLKLSGAGADKVKRIFKGIFAVFDIVRMSVGALINVVSRLTGSFGGPISSVTEFIARIADMVVKFREALIAQDVFGVGLDNINETLSRVKDTVKEFFTSLSFSFDGIKNINLEPLKTFLQNLTIRFEPLSKVGSLLGKILTLIVTLVQKIAPIALKLGSIVAEGVGTFVDKITESLENFQPERVFDIINGGLLAGVLMAIRTFINKGSGMFSGVKDVLDSVKGSLEAWQQSLKADTLLKIAAAIGIMTVSIVALSMIDSKKLSTALGAVTVMFAELGLSLAGFQKISSAVNPLQMATMATGLIAVASALLIMSVALSTVSKLSGKQLVKGILAIGALVGMVKIAADTLSKSSGKMILGAIALNIFAVAITGLTLAVRSLAGIDTNALAKGLIGVGVIMTELALFMRTTDLSGMGIIKSVGILILAGAVNALVFAVSQMAKLDVQALTRGLTAIGVVLTELGLFITLVGAAPTLVLTAGGILVIAASMMILAEVLEKIGNLSWEQIAKGLTSIAVALTLIGAAGYLIPPTLILQAAGLVVMAGALVILSKALETMGNMTWDEIARGLVTLAGSMLILTVALTAMSGTLVGSAALLVASAALMALAPALKILGSMSWEEVARGLVTLAGTFLVLGVAGALLTPVVPTLLGLGGAMLLIGVAAMAAGAGIFLLSVGLSALAVSGAAGGAALVVVLTSIVGLIPMLVKTLGRAILALVDVLVAGAPTLLTGIVSFLNILLDGLIEVTPKIIEFVVGLVDTLLTTLADKGPDITAAAYSILTNFLTGLRDNIGGIVTLAYEIMTNFINGIAENIPAVVDAGWNLIISWIDGMRAGVEENLPRLMDSVRELGIAIVKGVAEGIMEGNVDAKNTIIELANTLIEGFKEVLGIHSPSTVFIGLAGDIVAGFVSGISSKLSDVKAAMTRMAQEAISAIKTKYTDLVDAGKNFVSGFANGISSYAYQAVKAAEGLATSALLKIKQALGISSPAKELIDVGMYTVLGFVKGVEKFAGQLYSSMDELGNNAVSALSETLSNVGDLVNMDIQTNPTITPVIDLSNVEEGNKQIDSMLANKNLNLAFAKDRVTSVSSSLQPQVVADTSTVPVAGNSVIAFTQNNYSPKELSRIDIYRQTRNQLQQIKVAKGLT